MPPNLSIRANLARLFRNPADDPTLYFGPGVEVAPIAPVGTEARGWQYWPFQNQNFIPRPDSEFTAQDLRKMSSYVVARMCIENCKDVITSMPRQIRAKKKPGETNKDVDKRSKGDATLKMLNNFFDCPDSQHDWESWLREWLEGVYVGDWASVYVRRLRNGKPYQLRVIDGAFINCQIDEFGYRPEPPRPAYQQLWSGTPATVGGIPYVDLTTDQLVYWPRNIVPRNTVSSYLYGLSHTEQAAEEIALGQQRLNWWLLLYTAGVIPDMIHVVPPGISTDQLNASQKTLDAEMSGQLYRRAGAIKLLQGFVDRAQPGASSGDQFIQPKEKAMAEPFDEMHLRKMSFIYGSSAQRLMKQMNRASAQAGQEAAEEEGTEPVANSVRGMVNWVIAKIFNFGFDSYEMTFDETKEIDPVKRATVDKTYVDSGIRTRNQVREGLGDDPIEDVPEADELMITTASGAVPLSSDLAIEQQKNKQDALGTPEEQGQQGKKQPAQKRRTPKIDPSRHTPHSRQAQARLEAALGRVFMRQKEKALLAARRLLKGRVAKASAQQTADEINRELIAEWASLPVEARAAIEQAGLSAVSDSLLQLEISDTGLLSSSNRIAEEYAAKRAAEMVGMKYNAAGELVENPNAKWAISSTTRDRLREIIKNAFEEKTPFSEVIDDIGAADIFSESRAAMIAKTEISNAQVGANFTVWKQSGLVKSVKWLALGPDPCPICLANNGEIRALGAEFTSGDEYPTAHPNCFCILQAVEFEE